MEWGGGPQYQLEAKLAETFSLLLGGPTYGLGAALVAAQCVFALAFGMWCLSRRNSDVTTVIVLGLMIPLVQVVTLRPPFLFVRYFLIAIVFGLFAIAGVLGYLYRRRGAGRWAYACLLCGFLAANTWHSMQLVRLGRGNYRAALELMAQTTDSPRITISSDHDFGVRKLVEFYGPLVSSPATFEYIPGQSWPPSGPQWVALHRDAEEVPQPIRQRLVIEGHTFELQKVFECAPLSGWQWLCYRRSSLMKSISVD
jgi:hypothetical protein